jgi:hypothetical protein
VHSYLFYSEEGERCGVPGKIVHHKVTLAPNNINEPMITLNHELLEYLCQGCQNKELHGNDYEVTAEGLTFNENGELIPKAPLKNFLKAILKDRR